MQTVNQQLLPAPSLPQLNADGTLSISRIKGGIHVRIPVYPGMQVGDQVSVPWEGTPAHPEIGYAAIHIVTDAIEPKTYAISYMDVYNKWQKLKIWYHVNRLGDSESVVVDIVP
jgi:hypothetical protein